MSSAALEQRLGYEFTNPALLRRALSERPHIKALFWDQATLYQPPRTKEEDEAFYRALNVMMDLYASAIGTTWALRAPHAPICLARGTSPVLVLMAGCCR